METNQERNQFVSAIEQSIKSALSLINYDFGGSKSLQSVEEDPIISLYGPVDVKQEESKIPEEVFKSINPPSKTPSLSKVNEQADNKPNFPANKSPARYSPTRSNSLSHESVLLNQLENPIQNTIDEMQRVLNARGDGFPEIKGPSPEDILNLYSRDLGISLSSNNSPRGDMFRSQHDNVNKREKQNKKDKEESKRAKQSKLKISEKKGDGKKRKKSDSEILDPKEAKLKELMKIYVGSNKIQEPNYESKSQLSKRNSLRKLKQDDELCRTSSTALSKRSKRKKIKCPSKSDIESDIDFTALEKSSRLSTKRKSKQRRSLGDMKILKKANIKRSSQKYSNEGQVNKENVLSDCNISSNKITKYTSRKYIYNNNKRQTQSKKDISNNNDHLYQPVKSFSDENDRLKNNDNGILRVIPSYKQNVGVKSKLYNSDPQSKTQPSKKTHLTGNLSDLEPSGKKTLSEEESLNQNVLFSESATDNVYPEAIEDQEVHINLLKYDKLKNNDKGIITALPNNKQNVGAKSKSYSSEAKNMKRYTQLSKKSRLTDSERDLDFLGKKTQADEGKLNKTVLFSESTIRNTNTAGNQEIVLNSVNFDPINDDFLGECGNLHYTLPTQSSRSKEVERFLHGHYGHSLPFVIGQSTNKSHNLWVNIQEALSLIKQKVPQPSEPANSVVNEWAESERPLSVLSKLTTRSVKKPHHCPAVMSDSLYAIPEASTELDDATVKTWEDHPECIKANMDPNYVRSRCSCSSQPVMSYKKVLQEIFGKSPAVGFECSVDGKGTREDFASEQGDSYTVELRKALVSFTQEFEEMNNKYEAMLKDEGANQEELKLLEMQLENKEEEIKEIIDRFNEVKEFHERSCMEGARSRTACYNLESFKSTTSIRLAQTLHRVQKFKEALKSRPNLHSNALGCY